ncbi:UDP-glucose:undecaprenyl-phosphate glucose-1-phosphate transferase [Rubripirellula tenax]|uniref:UDP-glucose:undecaprenyl-phosphate glucose-1-phosphate transferase n=1 Tax=Rubripirellula tenax TaxID=2528015 RepID=A0A5C6EIS5_9BACT|nr:sugar transferase [Rubripirellula tenax]TWU47556.1 UDP-glucose:undecaprenyl-phosphate glucose-1-phosphate transferase [Rubripirellula tenax]
MSDLTPTLTRQPVTVDDGRVAAEPTLPIQPPSLLRQCTERVLALGMLIVVSPLIGVLALAVHFSSPGPVIYRQVRSGLWRRPFYIYKFRSMVEDAEGETGAVWSTKDDPRVTVIGYYLRLFHLDELPQLVNIIRGEMCFVGPRPERPEIIAKIEAEIPGYGHRLGVMPGVTGLAQVNLDPDETINCVKRKFELDIEYIFSATSLLDLRIVLATFLKMFGVSKASATALFGIQRVPIVRESVRGLSDDWLQETRIDVDNHELVLEPVG